MLVLSVFPGLGLLDRAFEESGFCVVRGPDLLWGGDVRGFHPPAGAFAGVIGGPPCKRYSSFRHLLRARGFTPAEDLIPEFERVVAEARPLWFLMENVPAAPKPAVGGYWVTDYIFDNRWTGAKQSRRRRFSFGALERNWKLQLATVALEDPEKIRCVSAGDGKRAGVGSGLAGPGTLTAQRLTIGDTLEAQGLPRGFLDHCPLTKEGAYRIVGNGVPLPMGRVFARAIAEVAR